ncbi:hypothetical protein SAMN04487898_105155 [Pedobacter sp. ok626]|uniref:phage upper tail fiber protein n=1 Tax=Pedobacter sp. ok626 TaxID=1761882 RepID=UPI00088DDD40|nr:hypothetical protein [Pedobacter sp. ok626]SDJ95957.1 hypothetical protein SAMN04487898_105155 [Pedobacter sp. ok626]
MNIQYNIKTQIEDYDPNLWNAQDANEVKTVVNSKADLTALQSEIDNRVNAQTDIINDIVDLQDQIGNLSGNTGGDLSSYYNKQQSDSRFLSITGTTLFSGDYNSLTNKPIIPSISGLATETWVNSQGFLKSFAQDFNYNSLTNKPDLSLKVDKVAGKSLLADTEITRLSTVVNQDLSGLQAVDQDLQNQIDSLSGGNADLTNYYTKAQSDGKYIGTGTTMFDGNYNSLSNKPDLAIKVDKVAGKGLSTEDYSTVEKSKLASIASGATVNQTNTYLLDRANHTGAQAATTITQTATARFATDSEKTTWNAAVPSTRTVAGKALSANITLVKGDVGLANVDNTSDANKPVSTATQTALNLKANVADVISNSSDTYGTKITNIVSCTQAQYDGLTPDTGTFYIII